MYDTNLTRISLPSKKYCYFLGVAQCVFTYNVSFVIESILKLSNDHNWYDLIDSEAGTINREVKKTISKVSGPKIYDKFEKVIYMRNRIIHGLRCTDNKGRQILGTKERGSGVQFYVDEKYLLDFINLNNELCDALDEYRNSHQEGSENNTNNATKSM